jgi:hypothetical protein
MASFAVVCGAVMSAFNCNPPGTVTPNNQSAYLPGSPLSCTCGNFNPTNRVIAVVQDAILGSYYNQTLAAAQPLALAAPCAPAAAPSASSGLTAAVVILALLLAGAVAYIVYPYFTSRDTSRMIGAKTSRTKNPVASVVDA